MRNAHIVSAPARLAERGLDVLSCPNPACPDHGLAGRSNVRLYTRYGRNQIRLLTCTSCEKTFSERNGTAYWDSRLPDETIGLVLLTLAGGDGIRACGRRFRETEGDAGMSKNTVKRHLRLAMASPNEAWARIELVQQHLADPIRSIGFLPAKYGSPPGAVSRAEFDAYLVAQAERLISGGNELNPARPERVAAAQQLVTTRSKPQPRHAEAVA